MPKNADLIKEATELAVDLGLEIDTEDLNNSQLVALVSDLKAKKKDAETETQADEQEPDYAPIEQDDVISVVLAAKDETDEAEKSVAQYIVATGKAITTKRGILSSGDEISAKDLAGGNDAINAFVKTGHIKENK